MTKTIRAVVLRRSVVATGVAEGVSNGKAAEALRGSKARLRLAAPSANTGLCDLDLKTNEIFSSPEWKSQRGIETMKPSGVPADYRKTILLPIVGSVAFMVY